MLRAPEHTADPNSKVAEPVPKVILTETTAAVSEHLHIAELDTDKLRDIPKLEHYNTNTSNYSVSALLSHQIASGNPQIPPLIPVTEHTPVVPLPRHTEEPSDEMWVDESPLPLLEPANNSQVPVPVVLPVPVYQEPVAVPVPVYQEPVAVPIPVYQEPVAVPVPVCQAVPALETIKKPDTTRQTDKVSTKEQADLVFTDGVIVQTLKVVQPAAETPPRRSTPKRSTPKRSTPKRSTPKRSTPKRSTPKTEQVEDKIVSEEVHTLRRATRGEAVRQAEIVQKSKRSRRSIELHQAGFY